MQPGFSGKGVWFNLNIMQILEEMYLSYSWSHWVFNECWRCDLFIPSLFTALLQQSFAKNRTSVSQSSCKPICFAEWEVVWDENSETFIHSKKVQWASKNLFNESDFMECFVSYNNTRVSVLEKEEII
jgi:hypothetical protein